LEDRGPISGRGKMFLQNVQFGSESTQAHVHRLQDDLFPVNTAIGGRTFTTRFLQALRILFTSARAVHLPSLLLR
jgi:hypothetical protein